MKLCDLTQFYSPLSGGVKRYVHEKIHYIQTASEDDEHVLIIPGPKTETIESERSRIYSIHSPLLSRRSRYRALINLRAVEQILEREAPDLIESGDPYQIAWKAIASGRELRIPTIGFYHSNFPEAYLRGAAKVFGKTLTDMAMDAAQRYVRQLYNQFESTLVPSEGLAHLLEKWGVNNVKAVELGVNTEIFRPEPDNEVAVRDSLGIPRDSFLLLYVGRLAPEKNTQTLFKSFALLAQRRPKDFYLLVIGDGAQREQLRRLREETRCVACLQYCTDPLELARYYRAADLFVHPGIQETFGFVALESQACGTPVVGIRGSYMDRIILHDQESWARVNTPEALADAIEEFSEKNLHNLSREVSRLAQERYSWPRVFERFFCIYHEVCSNYKKARFG